MQVPEAAGGPFEDLETRSFYETLPNLRVIIPAVLLGDAAKSAACEGTDSPITPQASQEPSSTAELADHPPAAQDEVSSLLPVEACVDTRLPGLGANALSCFGDAVMCI